MTEHKNPFQELYVTEAYLDGGAEKFVKGFSPVIVKHALGLFQPGNIILKGLPGSGKSMLLNLLRPDTRIAYHRLGVSFPVPSDFSKFIGAGINLNRSMADSFGQRPFHTDPEIDKELTPLYFADFINCWIVHDIFSSVLKFQNEGGEKLCNEIGISIDKSLVNDAAISLANDECWFGYFDEAVTDVHDFLSRLAKRVTIYRSFVKRNINSIPDSIQSTKTDIGIPITKAVQFLRNEQVLAQDVHVFVRIDQYEELAWLDEVKSYGPVFQRVIHKFLGLRDSRVSYRIGTRKFAWAPDPTMYGTSATIENERTHKEISIDEVLQRRENRKTWVFPDFAEDIFTRRLTAIGYTKPEQMDSLLQYVLSSTPPPDEKVKGYVKSTISSDKIIKFDKSWPDAWNNYLHEIAKESLLSAVLGAAWARQKGKDQIVHNEEFPLLPPWEEERKKWWRKERHPLALMQIASRNQQQLQWSGKEEVLALSGGNILAFLSLCQHIWDAWLRFMRDEEFKKEEMPKIDNPVQSIGIQEASLEWFEKISEAEHGDPRRQRFIRFLGEFFYKKLLDDVAMSNPGQNGFSVRIVDLDGRPDVRKFLNALEDHGNVVGMKHTSKTKGEKRRKWYLNPILSPYFNIFHVHTKEPFYATAEKIDEWMSRSNAVQPKNKSETDE